MTPPPLDRVARLADHLAARILAAYNDGTFTTEDFQHSPEIELIERNPGIEAASDDLYSVAEELVVEPDRGPKISRLREALLRFGNRLASARPSEQARHLGLA